MTFVGDLRGKAYLYNGWARTCAPHRVVLFLVSIYYKVDSLGSSLGVKKVYRALQYGALKTIVVAVRASLVVSIRYICTFCRHPDAPYLYDQTC